MTLSRECTWAIRQDAPHARVHGERVHDFSANDNFRSRSKAKREKAAPRRTGFFVYRAPTPSWYTRYIARTLTSYILMFKTCGRGLSRPEDLNFKAQPALLDLSICSPGTLMEKRAGWTKSELTAHTSDYARRISGKERKKLYAQVDTYVNSAHS